MITTCGICREMIAEVHVWDNQQVLCSDCNVNRCSFAGDGSPNHNSDTESRTIPACSSAACPCSGFGTKLKAVSFHVEDTIKHIWRCLVCDWSYSVFGQEMPFGLDNDVPQVELAAAGPISHHRFNSTQCISCGLYAAFSPWVYDPDVGFVCEG